MRTPAGPPQQVWPPLSRGRIGPVLWVESARGSASRVAADSCHWGSGDHGVSYSGLSGEPPGAESPDSNAPPLSSRCERIGRCRADMIDRRPFYLVRPTLFMRRRGAGTRPIEHDRGPDRHERTGLSAQYFGNEGFERRICTSCGAPFWSRDPERQVCGDAPCEPYTFIGNPVFAPHTLNQMRGPTSRSSRGTTTPGSTGTPSQPAGGTTSTSPSPRLRTSSRS